jgi:hypothetical protein
MLRAAAADIFGGADRAAEQSTTERRVADEGDIECESAWKRALLEG